MLDKFLIVMLLSLRICAGCNMDIGRGKFLNCMNALWHPECFRCRGCNQQISDFEVHSSLVIHEHMQQKHSKRCLNSNLLLRLMEIVTSVAFLQFSVLGGYPYHKTCYKESHHPKCDLCRQFVSSSFLNMSFVSCKHLFVHLHGKKLVTTHQS